MEGFSSNSSTSSGSASNFLISLNSGTQLIISQPSPGFPITLSSVVSPPANLSPTENLGQIGQPNWAEDDNIWDFDAGYWFNPNAAIEPNQNPTGVEPVGDTTITATTKVLSVRAEILQKVVPTKCTRITVRRNSLSSDDSSDDGVKITYQHRRVTGKMFRAMDKYAAMKKQKMAAAAQFIHFEAAEKSRMGESDSDSTSDSNSRKRNKIISSSSDESSGDTSNSSSTLSGKRVDSPASMGSHRSAASSRSNIPSGSRMSGPRLKQTAIISSLPETNSALVRRFIGRNKDLKKADNKLKIKVTSGAANSKINDNFNFDGSTETHIGFQKSGAEAIFTRNAVVFVRKVWRVMVNGSHMRSFVDTNRCLYSTSFSELYAIVKKIRRQRHQHN